MKYNFSPMRCLFALACVGIVNVACSQEPATARLELSGYNHTEKSIGGYSVSNPHEGAGAGNGSGEAGYLGGGEGGGSFTCCILVPAVWQPGMTVKVTWDGWVKNIQQTVSRVVPVPKYDAKNASTFDVHFLHDGEVKVFVTKYTLGHRDYPLKGKEAEMKPGVPVKIIWP
jgi:hypothetical protein